jgi:MFS family permease
MIVGALMDMIDVTIVNVALPTIRRDLHASATQLEWVVSGYMLASLAAGLSGSGAELIAARVVQGTAAAAMAPQVLATFRAMFAGAERGKAFSIYGAMLGFASAVGLLLGGVLTEANPFGWSWRAVFFVNVPVAAAALIAGLRFVPETSDPGARRPDVPGAVLLAASLAAIVYPLLEGRTLGWPVWAWLVLAAGVAGLGVLGLIAAGLLGRDAGVLPGLRAVAAGRRALLAAQGGADRGRVQRGQLHRGTLRGAAGPEVRARRAGPGRGADGRRDRG